MAPTILRVAGAIVFGYLLGGIPFGVIISRGIYHVDIMKLGSGSTGGTNVFRNLGWKAGLSAGLLDVGKGALAVIVTANLIADPSWSVNARDGLAVAAGLASIAGHSYSPFLGFRGGKGVATGWGVAMGLMPWVAVGVFVVFATAVFVTRVVSVGSILAAASYPLFALAFYRDRPTLVAFAAVAAVLVIWRHRSNMRRLIRGEEPRIDRSRLTRRRTDDKPGDDAARDDETSDA